MSSEQSYRSQIENIPSKHDATMDRSYYAGHSTAKAECAKIALEADATIAAQAAEIERLREVVGEVTAERDERDEAVKAKVLEIAGKDARIRELEDNDAIGRRLTDGHLARIAELEAVVGPVPTRWSLTEIHVDDDPWTPYIELTISPFYEGKRYAVRNQLGRVLNKSGKWEHEPIPSSRTDAFYKRCRFDSLESASLAAAEAKP